MFDSYSTQVLSQRNTTQSSIRMFEKLKKVLKSSKKAYGSSKKQLKSRSNIHKSSLKPSREKERSYSKVSLELGCFKILNAQRRFIRSYWETLRSPKKKIETVIEDCIYKTLNAYFADQEDTSSPSFPVEMLYTVQTFSFQEQKPQLNTYIPQSLENASDKIAKVFNAQVHRAFDLILLSRIKTVKSFRTMKLQLAQGLSIVTEHDYANFYHESNLNFRDTFVGAHKRMNSTSDVSLNFKI